MLNFQFFSDEECPSLYSYPPSRSEKIGLALSCLSLAVAWKGMMDKLIGSPNTTAAFGSASFFFVLSVCLLGIWIECAPAPLEVLSSNVP